MIRGALVLLAAALAAAGPAAAGSGRIAVGIEADASPTEVGAAVSAALDAPVEVDLAAVGAVVASVDDVAAAMRVVRGLPGVEYVEAVGERRLAFVATDPLVSQQWYLPTIRAFDAWPERPELAPVLVGVVDSGIDGDHPEFAGRIEAARSFVPGSPAREDEIGHGTMVAGEIAAAVDDGQGIAGVGFPVRLLVAKVVDADGTIGLDAEARAIRWVVDHGAKVVNLSLGGPRDPENPDRDTFSQLEQDAVEYAYSRGAVVVAATGNCDAVCPYGYASWPAALQHVVGVGALGQRGVATFSNRDVVFADLVAPGVGVLSTFPRALTEPGCEPVGYSSCAPADYRRGEGTSFAAPLVTAAAAVVRATRPDLGPDQVMAILGDTAIDVSRLGRDAKTGSGLVDVAAAVTLALTGPVPPPDRDEVNDDAGARAAPVIFPDGSKTSLVRATLDLFDDRTDVYAVRLAAGQRLNATLRSGGARVELAAWPRGTETLAGATPVRSVPSRGGKARLLLRADRAGVYYVSTRIRSGGRASYRLQLGLRPAA
ncbi:MAG: S8 family serine peptidase [Thermoleophilia bacterium]